MRFTFENDAPSVNAAIIKRADVAMAAVDKTLHRAAIRLANAGKRDAPKAFSQLTNSINSIRFGFADYGAAAGVDYARAVEEGTGSGGAPSIESLVDWIRVKNIFPDDPNMDTEDLAYVIQRMITLNGTPAQPYLKPAFEQIVERLPGLLARNVDKAMQA